jgi:hypothetical protein
MYEKKINFHIFVTDCSFLKRVFILQDGTFFRPLCVPPSFFINTESRLALNVVGIFFQKRSLVWVEVLWKTYLSDLLGKLLKNFLIKFYLGLAEEFLLKSENTNTKTHNWILYNKYKSDIWNNQRWFRETETFQSTFLAFNSLS